MGISIRQYAKHRGVFHEAVRYAIKTGKITPLPDGTIDPAQADKEWAEYVDTGNQQSSNSYRLTQIRAAKELTNAKLLDLKLKQETGKLVPLNEVKILFRVTSESIYNALRDFGNRVSPRLVAQQDITRITNIINEEIRRTLKEYTDVAEQHINDKFMTLLGEQDD
jgi:hypothetical protein